MTDKQEAAMNWLVCVAEGDREGLVINLHMAKRAAAVRTLLAELRDIVLNDTEGDLDFVQFRVRELLKEMP